VRGGLEELEETLRSNRVDAVYLALPNAQAAAVPSVLQRLERFAVDVRIVPDVHPKFVPQSMVVNELDGMPILSYRENPSQGLGGLSKRALDILGSVLGLIVFSPVFLAIAIAVRMTSPGPVIFKQRRVSLGTRTFKIYKFRTMYQVSDEEHPWAALKSGWTQRDDPRITTVGRWLRKTSLDELPQLINVLKGQMSLVGPRPERPELIEKFREDWRGYMLRQHVKAGITGWAQVNGLRGDTSLRKRIQYDLFYVRHWSLGFDLRILWLTVFRGFVHRNAF
jgi:Undecaprenyl-phosphate glucose phosphotransferase